MIGLKSSGSLAFPGHQRPRAVPCVKGCGNLHRVCSRWSTERDISVGASRMSAAEVARTITSLLSYGTLSTINDSGSPLGTYVTFVLDDHGCPLLRLRADAVHTSNLQLRSQCTLFLHAAETPARQLARVTLLGTVETLSKEEAISASARHAELYRDALGVDSPHPEDTFMRLKVEDCFFVSGLGVRLY